MEQTQEQKRANAKKKTGTNTTPIRIKEETVRLIRNELAQLNNKKFGNGDDELYYWIDLDDDISKIQCSPINLQ